MYIDVVMLNMKRKEEKWMGLFWDGFLVYYLWIIKLNL